MCHENCIDADRDFDDRDNDDMEPLKLCTICYSEL